MAAKITNISELFHRFHNCEMQLRQSKIAACLISFKEIIDKIPAIPKSEKEKNELNQSIEVFLKNLSAHKKFQELFGNITFGDTDLQTNLEFIKSMIIAQEQDIMDRFNKDEEAAEAMRLDMSQKEQETKEAIRQKIEEAIKLIDAENIPQALDIINEDEAIRESVIQHYNDIGIQKREEKMPGDAIQNYNKALILTEEDEHLHYNIARAYFEDGNNQKAEEFLDKAIKLNPEFQDGKLFYDYILKLNCPTCVMDDNASDGFFQKIISFGKRLIPHRSAVHTS
jgi:tetratricopeptide (TPR) repeat protein